MKELAILSFVSGGFLSIISNFCAVTALWDGLGPRGDGSDKQGLWYVLGGWISGFVGLFGVLALFSAGYPQWAVGAGVLPAISFFAACLKARGG